MNNKNKRIDGFIFYNELDMLYFRLKELYDKFDYFILVECDKTFTGINKRLYYDENKDRFSEFSDKILHIIFQNEIPSTNPHENEIRQRDVIGQGFDYLNLNDNDIVFVSDVDEIPNVNMIDDICNQVQNDEVYALEQQFFYYNLECVEENPWVHHRFLDYYTFKKIKSCSSIRGGYYNKIIPFGGWHFSYFGDVEFIRNKIKNFACQEYNSLEYTSDQNITDAIKSSKDLFKRNDVSFKKINLSDNKVLPNNYKLLLDIHNNIDKKKQI